MIPATRAEIDLDVFVRNITAMRDLVGEQVRLMSVVKADAYGHGAPAMGKVALDNGVACLAVYTADEAIYLRHGGVEGEILVLGPIQPRYAHKLAKLNITPCIANLELARALSQAAGELNTTIRYHVELDTGLTRYGLVPEDALALLRSMSTLPGLHAEGIFTHFASADEKDPKTTLLQYEKFMAVVDELSRQGFDFPIRHVAASAAILNFPEMRLDLVRCGLSLFGYYPSDYVKRPIDLGLVMAVRSYLARVKSMPAGTGVSYGHDWVAPRDSVIGLVPFGYADGLPRQIQGKGYLLVSGQHAPIVGRIAMDQCMLDLTDLTNVRAGDQVTIIGRSGDEVLDADQIAAWAGTISYDVLSGLSDRVSRVYLSNQEVVGVRSGMTMDPPSPPETDGQ